MALAEAAGATVLEDDVYRQLWFHAPPPPPLQAYGEPGSVIRLGSFSKILAPGLRLGWLLAPPAVVERCKDSGLLDSGGGLSHFTAHVAGEFIALGLLDAHVERLRQSYKSRCEALAGRACRVHAARRDVDPAGWRLLRVGVAARRHGERGVAGPCAMKAV